MTEDHVFPEDSGTGATGGDNADAANFGALAQHDLLSDYKASGLSVVDTDFANLTFSLTAGKAFVKDSSATSAQSGDVRDQGVVYEVEVASRNGISFTDDTTNEIFLDVDLSVGDSISVDVRTDGTTPTEPFLKIAEFDATFGIVDESFANGIDLSGDDLEDGVSTIYDSSAGEIQEPVLPTINNSTLANSSVTVNSGTGLSNGGTINLGGNITLNLTNDSIDITAGNALSGGGSLSLGSSSTIDVIQNGIGVNEIDESIEPVWTGLHTFNTGITGLPEPTNGSDAATKVFVESIAEGLTLKESVATSNHDSNIDLSSSTDPNPIDGRTLQDGERILLKHQTDSTENGIYDAVTATDPSTWVRSSDFDEDSEVVEGTFVFIRNGTVHANTSFVVISGDPITVGTDPINFSQFAGAGEILAGTNLTKDGTTINLNDSLSLGGAIDAVGRINAAGFDVNGSPLDSNDVGAVDDTEFPDFQLDGTTIDSTDTVNFKTQ